MSNGNTKEVVLIDLSSIAYPIWHTSQSDPDPNKTSQMTVARVRALATDKPHVAICCDGPRSFRRDITPTYKANRPEQDGTLKHQITLAQEQLAADGFPIWAVPSFEADDLIATGCANALFPAGEAWPPDLSVLIVTADKDLLQLVGPRVRAMSVRDGSILDADGVAAKFGVKPEQIRDYLTLVGDKSDNIAGAKGIGEKKAADLLVKFTSLDALYEQLEEKGGASIGLPPAMSLALRAFKADGGMDTARMLVTLRTDVELPFSEVFAERVPKEVASFGDFDVDADGDQEREKFDAVMHAASAPALQAPSDAVMATGVAPRLPESDAASSIPNGGDSGLALAVREPDILPAPTEWERQLDPRSMRDARVLAKDMHDSRLFSAYGTPQGVLSTVMVGRELGLPAMASLRGIHIIEGKHSISAQMMVALVLKSGIAEYFRPVTFSETEATYETHRKGPGNQPIKLTHTIQMAMAAGLVKDKSGWQKNPTDMLVARASSRLARMVYPDIVGGLYTPEELAELREAVA